MFDIGFSEVLLIFVIALIVLGPEKLPRAASQVGRWVGRARAMARQFKEQLEEEVNLENVRKAHKETAAKEEAAGKTTASSDGTVSSAAGVAAAGAAGATAAAGEPASVQPHDAMQAVGGYSGPDPADFRADTFSHAHPTNEYGANPLTANGAPPEEPAPHAASASVSTAHSADASSPGPTSETGAPPPHEPFTAGAGASSNTHSANSTEAHAAATTLNPPVAANEPVREPAPATPTQPDNHGHS